VIALAIIEGILMYFIVFPIKMFIICPVFVFMSWRVSFIGRSPYPPQCRQSYVFI